jgi:hypothetical protein
MVVGLRRRFGAAVSVIGVVALLAGCAQPAGPLVVDVGGSDRASDLPLDGPLGESCDRDPQADPWAQASAGEPMPADRSLVLASRCVWTLETVPGDGEWAIRLSQETTSGLEALAQALRLPNEQAGPNLTCTAIAYAPIIISVTDDRGRPFQPTIPTTACGAPRSEVTDAITAMPWITVETTRTHQVRSELELTSGCSSTWKPVIAIAATESGAGSSTVDTTAREMRVCRYDVGTEPSLDMGGGIVLHDGVLVAASTLDADGAGQLLAAIDAAPPAAACAQVESPFAVVYADNGPWVAVELDGCYRALIDSGSDLRQLDVEVVSRLLG